MDATQIAAEPFPASVSAVASLLIRAIRNPLTGLAVLLVLWIGVALDQKSQLNLIQQQQAVTYHQLEIVQSQLGAAQTLQQETRTRLAETQDQLQQTQRALLQLESTVSSLRKQVRSLQTQAQQSEGRIAALEHERAIPFLPWFWNVDQSQAAVPKPVPSR